MADKARDAVNENVKQVKEFIKLEMNEGEVVFHQNSLTHEWSFA